MSQELMIIKQLPILEEKFKDLSAEIEIKVNKAMELKATEENRKTLKDTRSELKKEFTDYEDKRKNIKNKIMNPYNEFDSKYKEYVSDKYKKADLDLKTKIDTLESEIKQNKERDCLNYYTEYARSLDIDFTKFLQVGLNIGLSNTLASLKKQIKAFLDKVRDDLKLIDTQENKPEILVEYKNTLNVSNSITTVVNRFKAIEEEKTRQEELRIKREEEAIRQEKLKILQEEERLKNEIERKRLEDIENNIEPEEVIPEPVRVATIIEEVKELIAPKIEIPEEKVMTTSFKVTAKISKLKELKEFLVEGGYEYE